MSEAVQPQAALICRGLYLLAYKVVKTTCQHERRKNLPYIYSRLSYTAEVLTLPIRADRTPGSHC